MTIQEQIQINPRTFRNCMGCFATGVTVVTTVVEGHPHGMTANSFLSVSLNPPLILVSLDKRARMHRLLTLGSRYGISILAESQQHLSNHFAGSPVQGLQPPFTWVEGLPLLSGAVGHIVARVVDAHPAGDHTLLIGQVEHMAWSGGWPLLFYNGRYEQLDRQGSHAWPEGSIWV